jgi:hypothetical protein
MRPLQAKEIQMPRPLMYMAALAGTLQLMACSFANVGANSDAARLPTGVTLLESNEAECIGNIQIDQGSRVVRNQRALIVVRAGENATFPLDDTMVRWTCVAESSARSHTFECPRESSHVRVTRSSVEEDLLFECYG